MNICLKSAAMSLKGTGALKRGAERYYYRPRDGCQKLLPDNIEGHGQIQKGDVAYTCKTSVFRERETHDFGREMTVAAVAAGLSKYERIKEMSERRCGLYCRLFHYITVHERLSGCPGRPQNDGKRGFVKW